MFRNEPQYLSSTLFSVQLQTFFNMGWSLTLQNFFNQNKKFFRNIQINVIQFLTIYHLNLIMLLNKLLKIFLKKYSSNKLKQ
ncbi:hypothetical protein pb186bvf_014826 [Paramecium bursaria]